MSEFAREVMAWQRQHGRHALPWQGARNAYAIWVSEIMLQQTQVSTVIPFYERFLARFPDVHSLADAPLDDVLAHWSGLGYYSRARHLHAAAREMCVRHGGEFPTALEAASALPGIGRSTAAAILAFAYGARQAILDGNVKRVLARCFGIRGYPGEREVNEALWRQADALLPETAIETYTQGLMDLGALVCTRRRPRCTDCPLRERCVALKEDCVDELPRPRPRKPVPHKSTIMLVLEDRNEIFLERRPPTGIWGGLWCFPELGPEQDIVRACAERYGAEVAMGDALPPVVHTFTHFRLTITPQRLRVTARASPAMEPGHAWWLLEEAHAAGLPSPVRRIIESLSAAACQARRRCRRRVSCGSAECMSSSESSQMDWEHIRAWRKERRAELIARREGLLLEDRRSWNQKITALLIDGFPLPAATIVGFCWPYKAEFDARFALRHWREQGVTSALPEVVGKGEPLKFRKWSPGVAMRAGVYGIPFPVDTEEVIPDVAIVPMNGFDEQGYRLGYGGGYFDRTLGKWSGGMVAIGVSYEALRLATIYPQPHDIPMDFVITEGGIHIVRGGRLDRVDEAASSAHARSLLAARYLPRAAPLESGSQLSSPVCYAAEFPGYWAESAEDSAQGRSQKEEGRRKK